VCAGRGSGVDRPGMVVSVCVPGVGCGWAGDGGIGVRAGGGVWMGRGWGVDGRWRMSACAAGSMV
jgi:hypothetical protein